jgi:hypothetical protein
MNRALETVLAAGAAVVAGIVCLYVLGILTPRADPDVDRYRSELRAERDSTAAWRARAARAAAEAQRLREDSAIVYPLWSTAREAAAAGVWAVRAIAQQARDRGDTSVAEQLETATLVIEAERQACSVVILNCEQRAANAETARADAAQRVDSLDAQLDTLGVRWEDAERRARPSFFRDMWRAKGAIGSLLVILTAVVVTK